MDQLSEAIQKVPGVADTIVIGGSGSSPIDASASLFNSGVIYAVLKPSDERGRAQNFHVVKEAIINAERHSQGTKILISSVVTDSLWTISVVDNGIGIQTKNKRPDSYGMTGIVERAESIGATLVIESPLRDRDYGTAISISLPVNNDDESSNDSRSR
jgi:glucose-6-phosphate-specific signal transduction histidine kinase